MSEASKPLGITDVVLRDAHAGALKPLAGKHMDRKPLHGLHVLLPREMHETTHILSASLLG